MDLNRSKKRKAGNNIRIEGEMHLDPKPRTLCTEAFASSKYELNSASKTMGLPEGNSNFFQMQAAALLGEVSLDSRKIIHQIDPILRKIEEVITKMPPVPPCPYIDAKRVMSNSHDISVPFVHNGVWPDPQCPVSVSKPMAVNIIGSVPQGTAMKDPGFIIIDMAVTMPAEIFRSKDFLNYKYFQKKAFYLANIAANLKASKSIDIAIQYDWQNGNSLQPVLLLSGVPDSTKETLSTKEKVRVLLGPPEDYFPPKSLLPGKCCVKLNESRQELTEPCQQISSHFYNSSLRSECLYDSYNKLLLSTMAHNPKASQAVVLSSVWLRQRGFGTEIQRGGFGAFEAASMIALMLQQEKDTVQAILSRGHNELQLFRGLLSFVATTDLVKNPFILNPAQDGSNLPPQTGPLFFDGVRKHNILFKMTNYSYWKLRRDCQVTLACFNRNHDDFFDSCFIDRVDNLLIAFDRTIILQFTQQQLQKSRLAESTGWHGLEIMNTIGDFISQALGDRLLLLMPQIVAPKPYNISEVSSDFCQMVCHFGLLLDASNIDRIVDRGPSADDQAAASEFRKFWGSKSELRRFQSGEILESLVWTSQGNQPNVLRQIVSHTLSRHICSEVQNNLRFIDDQPLEKLLHESFSSAVINSNCQAAWRAFELLQGIIRSFRSLPLQIRQISPHSAILTDTTLYGGDHRHPSIDVSVQFESSARWPDNIDAIQRTKGAFLIRLSELLKSSNGILDTLIGLENVSDSMLNKVFLDVRIGSFTFRLRTFHDRELHLLDRRLRDSSTTPSDRKQAACAIASFKRMYDHSPRHTQHLKFLCTRYQCLAATIRVFKRWCSNHFLASHFTPEFLELLVVRIFTDPFPFTTPGSVQTAFLRLLSFISKWDWRHNPLLIDTSEEMSSQELQLMHNNFKAWRKIDPAMNKVVIFAASSYDPNGTTWTSERPTMVGATRMTALAQAAMNHMSNSSTEVDVAKLFRHSLQVYDFVIYFDTMIENQQSMRDAKLKNPMHEKRTEFSSDQKNARMCFIKDIEKRFGSCITIFHDGAVMSTIGGLWNADVQSRSWKAGLSYNTEAQINSSNGDIIAIPNRRAILNDISRLGGNMISNITLKESKGL